MVGKVVVELVVVGEELRGKRGERKVIRNEGIKEEGMERRVIVEV